MTLVAKPLASSVSNANPVTGAIYPQAVFQKHRHRPVALSHLRQTSQGLRGNAVNSSARFIRGAMKHRSLDKND
jgi:hypothetical protein